MPGSEGLSRATGVGREEKEGETPQKKPPGLGSGQCWTCGVTSQVRGRCSQKGGLATTRSWPQGGNKLEFGVSVPRGPSWPPLGSHLGQVSANTGPSRTAAQPLVLKGCPVPRVGQLSEVAPAPPPGAASTHSSSRKRRWWKLPGCSSVRLFMRRSLCGEKAGS